MAGNESLRTGLPVKIAELDLAWTRSREYAPLSHDAPGANIADLRAGFRRSAAQRGADAALVVVRSRRCSATSWTAS